ncbi:NifB/NifX family molybdenum-iron cluster-binding protein [Trichloromonas sp.]|uniref:NifB/NifX family molybdenum-iron cluster-binding protein n=1 Tax=Trichloromonas sp. TaxID=3069249 RepID=UPI002A4C09AE|nr:NifB/NifX family molybdenum-iron cluster-binding protein [Trichloromonas sp.]
MLFELDGGMNSNAASGQPVRIAIPAYGSRIMPRFGQAREFFFAEIDPVSRSLQQLQPRLWDLYSDPPVVRWLVREGVDAVLCGGIHPRFQIALVSEGVEIHWGFRGEVEEVVRAWLAGGCEPLGSLTPTGEENHSCPVRRLAPKPCSCRDQQGEKS